MSDRPATTSSQQTPAAAPPAEQPRHPKHARKGRVKVGGRWSAKEEPDPVFIDDGLTLEEELGGSVEELDTELDTDPVADLDVADPADGDEDDVGALTEPAAETDEALTEVSSETVPADPESDLESGQVTHHPDSESFLTSLKNRITPSR